MKYNNGEHSINFVVETKDVNNSNHIRDEEKFKIRHSEKFFGGALNVKFISQFKGDEIAQLIKHNLSN